MLVFPNAKINLGLNVVNRREDGFHNIETVFYPVALTDILEVLPAKSFLFRSTGIPVQGEVADNLAVKAWYLLLSLFNMPPIKVHLHKVIPTGAGLGGGSADGAFMLQLLNRMFDLELSDEQLKRLAAQLGADCPFFIENKPVSATGIGNILTPVELDLSRYHLVIVKPPFSVNTADAYKSVIPEKPAVPVSEVILKPVEKWRDCLINDFEKPVFKQFPQVKEIKDKLYNLGAVYAAMSGSGSAVYGLFHAPVYDLWNEFGNDYQVFNIG